MDLIILYVIWIYNRSVGLGTSRNPVHEGRCKKMRLWLKPHYITKCSASKSGVKSTSKLFPVILMSFLLVKLMSTLHWNEGSAILMQGYCRVNNVSLMSCWCQFINYHLDVILGLGWLCHCDTRHLWHFTNCYFGMHFLFIYTYNIVFIMLLWHKPLRHPFHVKIMSF